MIIYLTFNYNKDFFKNIYIYGNSFYLVIRKALVFMAAMVLKTEIRMQEFILLV